MRIILSIIALSFGLVAADTAQAGAISYGKTLTYVAPTTIPGGTAVSLCRLDDYMTALSIPVYTTSEGYVLSKDGCSGSMSTALNAQQFEQLQAIGYVSKDLPVDPAQSLQAMFWGHAWLVLAVMAVVLRLAGAAFKFGKRKKKAAPDALAIHSLVAMSQVAVADGRIDDGEIRQISHILTRLTGRGYLPSEVSQLLTQLNPSASDLAQVGHDLSDNDRQIVLEAALNIAAADGDIHQSEYAVLTDLAHRMQIGADQFRITMARLSPHLQPA